MPCSTSGRERAMAPGSVMATIVRRSPRSTTLALGRLQLHAQLGAARNRDLAQHPPRLGIHRMARRAQLGVARGDLDRVVAVPERHRQAEELARALPEVDRGRRTLAVPGAEAGETELAGVELAFPGRFAPVQLEVLEEDLFLELGAHPAQREAIAARRRRAQ